MSAPDPLDALFGPTTRHMAVPPAIASAAPVRERGTRTRAGNAMSRTRVALLEGARRAVEMSGTKITMAQVAAAGGVAKATLYNHFRTREAVLAALLDEEIRVLAARDADAPLADRLAATARALSEHPLLRALARLEPGTLAALGRIDAAAAGWSAAREAVTAALAAEQRGGADLVLRWLASYLLSPAAPEAVADELAILLAALPDVPDVAIEPAVDAPHAAAG